ncbi:c-type cytochrome [Sinomicrobium weinanense]|uniref:C-type cytochrome n=1 Tax=Sinomicrobium weinanense TaxID=2842200 RepID=A0A926Q536_9FLAO|nr:c-type cytochrome [Sinomicrobium weinanense]MBC9797545.1 c-type cytochrome [Sinomicrobium weinanense]MBU3123900.1 c-type cytochrome [Sinomicrobium weinanense]
MKEVIHRNSISGILSISLAILLAFSTTLFGQEGDPGKGKQLFNANCAACHKLNQKMTGPPLAGVTEKQSREWLHKWIKNNVALRKSGDPDAIAIYEEYGGAAMNVFPQLSEQDIDDILAYTAAPPPSPVAGGGADGQVVAQDTSSGISNEVVLGALVLVFAMLVIMLVLVNKTLMRIAEAKGIELPEEQKKRLPLWKAFVKNQFLVLVSVVFLLLVSAYFVYGYLMQVGVDQGYAPVQPIHFSHRIHAGDNEIDCKYCHSSARVSRTSGIPSLNVCMNCHKNIMEVAPETGTAEHSKEFYDGEIQKLYEAVGWDVENQRYTGETKPVKWVKIHNLPDFVYFNHSQHVSVAGLECQKCHGPIEEMEIVEQFSPLTMGWCVNCHRTTEVKMEGNEYYEKIHEELSKKYGVEKLTAAQMGALECGKCHY